MNNKIAEKIREAALQVLMAEGDLAISGTNKPDRATLTSFISGKKAIVVTIQVVKD